MRSPSSFMQSPSSTHLALIFFLFNKFSPKWLPNNAIQIAIRNSYEN
ncbi:hypothetical protein APA_2742 [Pseudanabaena sp. lw0831]|nr:hypothetical protein APA_2742 [Pseudanabaena sp. lw0831]